MKLALFLCKYLHSSKKCSIFAAEFVKINKSTQILTLKLTYYEKTYLILALGLLLTTLGAQAADKEIYSKLVDDGKTLLFVYDDQRSGVADSQHPTLYDPANNPGARFEGYNVNITAIHLDESMKDYKPLSLRYFFGGSKTNNSLYNVTQIRNLDYLNTSSCQTMECMFFGMNKLESVDLSKFNTTNVQTMTKMFMYCQKLASINLSAFNTWKVTKMDWMFFDCRALTALDVTILNTSNVTNMNSMFQNCGNVKELNLLNFDMAKVTDATYMFAGCSSLVTILCGNDWSKLSLTSDGMFQSCNKLKGGKGTTFDSAKQDKTYARPDGGTSAPGYFTAPKKVYTEFVAATSTLTYYCDDKYGTREGIIAIYNPSATTDRFSGYNEKVLTIDVDASMADTSLTDMRYFFSSYNTQLTKVTSIKHLEYINTSKTENAGYMFYGLKSIESLDISSFDTQNMTTMDHMFPYCEKMTSLRLGGNFNTAKSRSFREMFLGCKLLKAIDCTHFEPSATSINMGRTFADCPVLVTIYCNDDWSVLENMVDWDNTFRACTALKGGKGTTFNSSYIKNQYARPDGGPESETPGYFTPTSVLQDIKDEVYESLDALKKGENTKVDAIIAAAKSEVNAYVWDLTMTYDENVADFDTEFSYTWYMDVKTAVQNQYELDQNLEKLYAAIADLTALRMFADNYLENAELVASINTDINNAFAVYSNPSATLAEVNAALKNATDAIENYKGLMMPMAKEQLKADINALLKEGDPQACKDIVDAAVAQVDVIIVWDDKKSVTDNILALAAAGEKLYNDTKAAVEEARKQTAINNQMVNGKCQNGKLIRNGQLFIQRGDELFNATGARVK